MSNYVINKDLSIFADCNLESKKIGMYKEGETVDFDKTVGAFSHSNKGWVYRFDGSNAAAVSSSITKGNAVTLNSNSDCTDTSGTYIPNGENGVYVVVDVDKSGTSKITEDGKTYYWVKSSELDVTTTSVTNVDAQKAQAAAEQEQAQEENDNYFNTETDADVMEEAKGNISETFLAGLRIQSTKGIFGMPYQYMDIADPKIDTSDDSFGATYAKKIVSRLPLLIMIPGVPKFLAGASKTDKENVMTTLLNNISDALGTSNNNDMVSNIGKYYGLKPDWTKYFLQVNPMCQFAAKMLGLDGYTYLDGGELGNYNWESGGNPQVKAHLAYKGGICFYLNSENQISEGISSGTSQSMLAQKVNSISDIGREINFLMGSTGALGNMAEKYGAEGQLNKNAANTKDMTKNMLAGNNLISGIANGLSTVIAGGKLIFPEIWSDTQYSREYEVSVKLVSPDNDLLSLYLNIIVPLLHLIGFALPRSNGANGYFSPFLVRAFYKGMFNIDMGIITNMSIQKGGDGNWSIYGIPNSVDVHFTIKELYSTLALTATGNTQIGLVKNLSLMDYIGNLCGININESDWRRTMWFYTHAYAGSIPSTVETKVVEGLAQWGDTKAFEFFNRGWGIK